MKANPDIRWQKMPPGSAESLPPSNVKPSTPSPNIGGTCPKLLPASSLSISAMPDGDSPTQSSAPKPLKKRYVAKQQLKEISPEDAQRHMNQKSKLDHGDVLTQEAAAGLLELSGRGSGNSDSSNCETRGSPSETQNTTRQKIYRDIKETIIANANSQEEARSSFIPTKPEPVDYRTSVECTIRGQQIIEHIINNILDKPMNGSVDTANEPIFSLNNNQEPANSAPHSPVQQKGDGADSIKASIYESLKNDLLKQAKFPPMVSVSNSTSNLHNTGSKTSPRHPEIGQTVSSPRNTTKKIESQSRVPTAAAVEPLVSSSSSPSPIYLGNSAITITKTPRISSSGSTTNPRLSFSNTVSNTPASLSLTRTETGQMININRIEGVILNPPMVISPPQGTVVLPSRISGQATNLVIPGQQASEFVLLPQNLSSSGQGSVLQGQVLSPVSHSANQVMLAPGSGQSLILLTPTPPHSGPVLQSSNQQTSSCPVTQNVDPMNLTVSKLTPTISTSGLALNPTSGKRSLDFDDEDEIRRDRSSRLGKGKRYQEFVEDGRINVNSKKSRKSHKSGEDFSESDLESEPIPLNLGTSTSESSRSSSSSELVNIQMNHWKKKMRTTSLGENTQSEITAAKTSDVRTAISTAKSQLELDAKIDTPETLTTVTNQRKRDERESKLKNRFSGSSRSIRQLQPEKVSNMNKAFDARAGYRKGRGDKA